MQAAVDAADAEAEAFRNIGDIEAADAAERKKIELEAVAESAQQRLIQNRQAQGNCETEDGDDVSHIAGPCEHRDKETKRRAEALRVVHAQELSALQAKLADSAQRSRDELNARLAKRKAKRAVTSPKSDKEIEKAEIESKAVLEQQLLAERVAALEGLLTGQRLETKSGFTATEAAARAQADADRDAAKNQADALAAAQERIEALENELSNKRSEKQTELAAKGLTEISNEILEYEDEANRLAARAAERERDAALFNSELHATLEAARLGAIADCSSADVDSSIEDNDEAARRRENVLAKLKAKHEAAQEALDLYLQSEEQHRLARRAELKAKKRKAGEEVQDDSDESDLKEDATVTDVENVRRAALAAQQKAEEIETESLFQTIEKLEQERYDKILALKESSEKKRAEKRAQIIAKFKGAARAAELKKNEAEYQAKMEEELAQLHSAHAKNIVSTIKDHEAIKAAADAAASQLEELKCIEDDQRRALEDSLKQRRDREKNKLKERLAARSAAKKDQQDNTKHFDKDDATQLLNEEKELYAKLDAELDARDETSRREAEIEAASRYAAVAATVVEAQSQEEAAADVCKQAEEISKNARERLDALREAREKQRAASLLEEEADTEAFKLEEDAAQREIEIAQRAATQRAAVEAARAKAQAAKRIAEQRAVQAAKFVEEEEKDNAARLQRENEEKAAQRRMSVLKMDAARETARRASVLETEQIDKKAKLQRRLEAKKAKIAEAKKAKIAEADRARTALRAKHDSDSKELIRRLESTRSLIISDYAWAPEIQQRLQDYVGGSDDPLAPSLDDIAIVLEEAFSQGIVPSHETGRAVETILQRRHALEAAKLRAEQFHERSTIIADALNKILDEKAHKRAEILARDMSQEEKTAAFEDLEGEFLVKQKTAQFEAVATLDDDHLAAEAELRRNQTSQVFELIRKLDAVPTQVVQSLAAKSELGGMSVLSNDSTTIGEESKADGRSSMSEADMAAAQQAEIAALQEHLAAEKQAKLERIEAERKAAEEEARQQHLAKLAELEKEQQAAMQREREAAERQLEAEREKLRRELAENILKANAETNEEKRKQLVTNFEEEHERATKEIEAQQQERRRALKDRLAQRRKSKVMQQEADLNATMKQKEAEAKRKEKEVAQQLELAAEVKQQEVAVALEQFQKGKRESSRWSLLKAGVQAKLHEQKSQQTTKRLQFSLPPQNDEMQIQKHLQFSLPTPSEKDFATPHAAMTPHGFPPVTPAMTVRSGFFPGAGTSSQRDPAVMEFRQKLDRIETLIGKLSAAQAQIEAGQSLSGSVNIPQSPKSIKSQGIDNDQSVGGKINGYHDAEDPVPEADLIEISRDRLSPTKAQRLVMAEKLLKCLGLGGSVKLKVAESLPGNMNWENNAFRNSYQYDSDSGDLYLHIKRLNTYGDIALVLVHAISHLKTRDFDDDSSPQFQAEFHRNFKTAMQTLVKLQTESLTENTTAAPPPLAPLQIAPTANKPEFYQRESINDRIRAYAQASGYPNLAEYMSRYENTTSSVANESQQRPTLDLSNPNSARDLVSTANQQLSEREMAEQAAAAKEKEDLKRRLDERKRGRSRNGSKSPSLKNKDDKSSSMSKKK
uniref:Uncharacterized protein n=1 Tax=Aureoumbra lagunensis TaxID=44058 RepID=A0A7S3JS12_9STRA